MRVDDFDAVTAHGTARFAERASRADLLAPVPTCPGWTVRDLAEHLGEVHRWVVHAVIHGSPDAPDVDPPKGQADLVAWYRESADELLKTLRSTPVDAPAWHFGPKPRTAGWWWRRQAHEVTVHLHDLADPAPIDAAVAEDGIDEVRGMFFPRQVRLGRIAPLERSLALEVAETGRRHVFAGDGTGDPDRPVDATLSGPADLLYLAVWKRVSPDHPAFTTTGDPTAVTAVLSAALIP